MQAVIQKWGDNLGFKIPSDWAEDNGIKSGSKVQVITEKEKI
ncbi:MAG: AbrB/MazE/SpoVT family DNA-binding domain-containing protein [Treponema sp.]|nr:AbrB/MazE/SpoVT family DNA-binding domain-containing protein [Treponema sp.]